MYKAKIRYRLKKNAKNGFTALTGIEAFQMLGGSDCLIVKNKSVKGYNPLRYAYMKYCGMNGINENISVKNSCGVLNCVKKEHLIAVFNPTIEDKEYIRVYSKVNTKEELAHWFKVPIELL